MAQVQRASSTRMKKADFEPLVRQAAAKYRVPEALLAALIEVESGWNPDAVSKKGAQGLGQLMPATAKTLGVTDPLDPAQNIGASAKLLSMLVNKYGGNVVLALAAYNAGEPAVDKVQGVPDYPETVNFIKKVDKALTSGNIKPQPSGPPSPVSVAERSPGVGRVGPKKMPGDYIAIDRKGAPPPGDRPVVKLPGESIAVDRGGKPPPNASTPQTAASTQGPPGIGKISDQQMQAVLDMIASERAGVPLDQSREYTELQSGGYGGEMPSLSGTRDATMAAFERPPEYAGINGGPSVAPFYSGGAMSEPSELGWLARMFRPQGGQTFADYPQSER